MKKEFSIWLNIATICLCVCAIAIGVYAAQSAALTVSGTIGFKAHDLEATAAVKMYGHATSQDGTPVASTSPTTVKSETTITNNMTISLSTFYFTDMESRDGKAEDIVIVFTYTNKSAFEVLAKVTTAESSICDNTAVTAEVKNAYMAKGSSSSPTTGTMKITLQLDAGTETFSKEATVSINITLEKTTAKTYTSGTNQGNPVVVSKYTKEQQETIWNNTVGKYYTNTTYGYSTASDSYATYFPYYITMGKSSTSVASDDIKWLIVGYKNADNKVAVLEDSDKAALSAGILLANKDYIALSAEGLGSQSFHTTTASTNNINANDYYQSAIRTYLNGTSFISTYSLTDLSITIKPRAVSELYTDIVAEGSYTVSVGTISTPTSVGSAEDNFWLLSKVEIDTLFTANITETYYASASITTQLGASENASNTTSPVWWWLRSPDSYYGIYARDVYYNGSVSRYDIVSDSGAVRAAFQF